MAPCLERQPYLKYLKTLPVTVIVNPYATVILVFSPCSTVYPEGGRECVRVRRGGQHGVRARERGRKTPRSADGRLAYVLDRGVQRQGT